MRLGFLCCALALMATTTSGCEEPINCTAELRTSVVLSVVDAETGEDVAAMVTLLIDGVASSDVSEGAPGQYQLGSEQDGTFEVTVSADGYAPVTTKYEVTADECHVMTVEDTIELVPSP